MPTRPRTSLHIPTVTTRPTLPHRTAAPEPLVGPGGPQQGPRHERRVSVVMSHVRHNATLVRRGPVRGHAGQKDGDPLGGTPAAGRGPVRGHAAKDPAEGSSDSHEDARRRPLVTRPKVQVIATRLLTGGPPTRGRRHKAPRPPDIEVRGMKQGTKKRGPSRRRRSERGAWSQPPPARRLSRAGPKASRPRSGHRR